MADYCSGKYESHIRRKKVKAYFTECIAKVIGITKQKMNNMPSLLGEFGLAFEINNRRSFKTGNYSLHKKALSMYYGAVDANLLYSTIWNYSAGNSNKYGDCWNGEDLSIFSEGKERAAAGWKRPYPMATSGKPVFFKECKSEEQRLLVDNDDYNGEAEINVRLK